MLVTYVSPIEPCPSCGGILKWVEWGFCVRFGPANPTVEDGGCIIGPENRYCSNCKKFIRVEILSKRIMVGDKIIDKGPKDIAHVGDEVVVVQINKAFIGVIQTVDSVGDKDKVVIKIMRPSNPDTGTLKKRDTPGISHATNIYPRAP